MKWANDFTTPWNTMQDPSFHGRIMAVRTAVLDKQVGSFGKAPDGLIVNLGAGLDTRLYRLDNEVVHWIELDLPGVISFRRRLEEPVSERHPLIAGSVLDEDWIAEVKRDDGAKVLLIAEGLLPYFAEEERRKSSVILRSTFPERKCSFKAWHHH
jgi:O-methyltransferase involved in polyketide biosynthesis